MRFLIWSFASFQRNYSSYHLYEGILKTLLSRNHDILLIQKDIDGTEGLPESLRGNSHLELLEIPVAVDKTANLPKRYIADVCYSRASYKAIKQFGHFDAALVQSNNCAGIPLAALGRLAIPGVYNEQDIFPLNALKSRLLKPGLAYSAARFVSRLGYLKAKKVITVSHDMRNAIVSMGVSEGKVEVIPNWCRDDRNYLVTDGENEFIASNPSVFEGGAYRVVYAGNLGRMQDVNVVVEAANILKGEDILFLIVGSGGEKRKLEARAKELRLGNLIFMESQPESISQDIYAAADINLIPLLSGVTETCMPSKTAACIRCRRPFIALIDKDTWAEEVYSSVPYGGVVDSGDAAGLADKILEYRDRYGSRYQAVRYVAGEGLFSEGNTELYADVLEHVARGAIS